MLVEVNIKYPWQVPICSWQDQRIEEEKSKERRYLSRISPCGRAKVNGLDLGILKSGQICQRQMIPEGAQKTLRERITFWLCISVSYFFTTVSIPAWSIKINEFICVATSQYYKDSSRRILKRKLGWLEQYLWLLFKTSMKQNWN